MIKLNGQASKKEIIGFIIAHALVEHSFILHLQEFSGFSRIFPESHPLSPPVFSPPCRWHPDFKINPLSSSIA